VRVDLGHKKVHLCLQEGRLAVREPAIRSD
jgi:hypothetical protein